MENALKELVKVMNDVSLNSTNAFVLLGYAGITTANHCFIALTRYS